MNERAGEPILPAAPLLPVVGFALIAVGCALAWYLVVEILAVYNDPFGHHFTAVLSQAMEGAGVTVEGKAIKLNQNGAKALAVVVFVSFAMLGTGITSMFIGSGTRLLTSNIKRDIAWIRDRLERGN